ncbi:hypothetical protein [Deinococcus navajonensis]|uniref:Uncharacterized protein n=1 Tax=Deinococcus navajonensis TaxID=309884 RepID=A0ABV8XQU9_9DEIO
MREMRRGWAGQVATLPRRQKFPLSSPVSVLFLSIGALLFGVLLLVLPASNVMRFVQVQT